METYIKSKYFYLLNINYKNSKKNVIIIIFILKDGGIKLNLNGLSYNPLTDMI